MCPDATRVSDRALTIHCASRIWAPKTLKVNKIHRKGSISWPMSVGLIL